MWLSSRVEDKSRSSASTLGTISCASDGRLAERFPSEKLLPLGSRIRVRLTLERASPVKVRRSRRVARARRRCGIASARVRASSRLSGFGAQLDSEQVNELAVEVHNAGLRAARLASRSTQGRRIPWLNPDASCSRHACWRSCATTGGWRSRARGCSSGAIPCCPSPRAGFIRSFARPPKPSRSTSG